jgi:hypothetical protein
MVENEKFQDAVLEHLLRIAQEITEVKKELAELKGFKEEINSQFDKLEPSANSIGFTKQMPNQYGRKNPLSKKKMS